MAKTKTFVVALFAILGLSSIVGGVFMGMYVHSQLETGIKDNLVVEPNYKTKDPNGYKDWLTNTDPTDAPKYKNYYFWNLTNPDAYLQGAKPIMEQIGPYSYRQYDVKVGVSITSTEVTYNTFSYYVFNANTSFAGANPTTDKIVNVNPQYIGVLQTAGSEAALVTGFVGPAISQVIDGLNTSFVKSFPISAGAQGLSTIMDGLTGTFAQSVLIQGMATVLQQVQATAVPNFHSAVNATTSANLIANVFYNTVLPNDGYNVTLALMDFFNNTAVTSPIPGFSTVAGFNGADIGFSNATAGKMLLDGAGSIPGWTSDLKSGSGILGYLQAYQNAIQTASGNTSLQQLYGATQLQLDSAAGYLESLVTNNATVEGTYQSTYSQSTLQGAYQSFAEQWGWGNVTTPLNVTNTFPHPTFELSANSNISSSDLVNIWNSSLPLAITNESGILAWFTAAGGNTTLQTALAGTFHLNTTQEGLIFQWLASFKSSFTDSQVFDHLNNTLGLTTTTDIGYFQWANSALTSNKSVASLDPSITTPIELWYYEQPATLNLGNVTALMTGSYNLTDPTGLGTFLLLGAQAVGGNATALGTLNYLFGTVLTGTEIGQLLDYLQNVLINNIVLSQLPISTYADAGYFQWANSSLTSGLSVYDIDPTGLPGTPEYWATAGVNMSLANAKALLLNGNTLTNSTLVGVALSMATDFAAAAATNNVTTMVALTTAFNNQAGSDLSPTEFGGLLTYLNYIFNQFVIKSTLDPIFNAGGGLITTRTPTEWLFNYTDPLLAFLKDNGQNVPTTAGNFFSNPPASDANNYVNASTADTYKTGGDNISNVGQYVKWDGQSSLTGVWLQPESISGTDGTQFHPNVKSSQDLSVWSSDLLRVLTFTYQKDVNIDGISLMQYGLAPSTLAVNSNYYQTVKGLANMTSSAGVPLFLSQPNFLGADASKTSSLISGMAPNATLDSTYLDVEPMTGAVLSAAKRLQINFHVGPSDLFTKNVSKAYIPIMWIEESGNITPSLAHDFKAAVYGAQNLSDFAYIGGPVFGFVLLFGSVATVAVTRKP